MLCCPPCWTGRLRESCEGPIPRPASTGSARRLPKWEGVPAGEGQRDNTLGKSGLDSGNMEEPLAVQSALSSLIMALSREQPGSLIEWLNVCTLA